MRKRENACSQRHLISEKNTDTIRLRQCAPSPATQVFIDYNISGMSYVHLKNALFLLPLPELSSIPASELHAKDQSTGSEDTEGVFTASTVPDSLIAWPPGESPATARGVGSTPSVEGTTGQAAGSERSRAEEVGLCGNGSS